jgi:tryptophan halogenase
MRKFKIVIVGGGTAGWLCAARFSKTFPNVYITLIESPDIPKIGVGESVTPHVSSFFNELGITETDLMKHTGSIYKYANKFINWGSDPEYFSFSYTTDINLLQKDIGYATKITDSSFHNVDVRTTDSLLKLLKDKTFDKFDKQFNSQYHYMVQNTAPFNDQDEYLLNPLASYAHHINAELTAEYVRDTIALPNGVKHIKAKVKQKVMDCNNIKHLVLDNDTTVDGDLFIDASGFHKILVNDWPTKRYENHRVDSAWVCQLDYEKPREEMVNYTQSIAQDNGWLFKIGLYHRMGSGYCFSSDHVSRIGAKEDYCNMVNNRKMEPRFINWEPTRLESFGQGNTAAIGLSCGFIEPLEANALYIIVTSIRKLENVLEKNFKDNILDFSNYNNVLGYAIDDIADFILVHYTLSAREDTEFWRDMRAIGIKENHAELVYEKYIDKRNSISSAFQGMSMFPDYMWAQLAYSWGLDLSKWIDKDINSYQMELSKLHFEHLERKHRLVSQNRSNNFSWLKDNRFNSLTPKKWEKKYLNLPVSSNSVAIIDFGQLPPPPPPPPVLG